MIHNEFQEVVENLLENICIELGATHEMFYQVVKTGLKNPKHKKYFEQIIATLNFMSFKKLMIKRNKELELEALEMLHSEGNANNEDLQKATFNKDQAEVEAAIAFSIAAEAERLRLEREEEEMIRKVLQESENEYKAKLEEEKKQKVQIFLDIQKKEAEKLANMEAEQKKNYEEQKRIEAENKQREEEEYKRKEELRAQNKRLEEETRKKIEEEEKKFKNAKIEEEKNQLRNEALRIENEAKKRKEEVLPPVQVRKQATIDTSEFTKLDISREIEESAKLDEINKSIAEKYAKKEEKPEEQKGESLEERTKRLKKQREILLEKKKAERANEMEKYLNGGGTDLSTKKELGPLPPIISQDVLDKRREIISKIKSSDSKIDN